MIVQGFPVAAIAVTKTSGLSWYKDLGMAGWPVQVTEAICWRKEDWPAGHTSGGGKWGEPMVMSRSISAVP